MDDAARKKALDDLTAELANALSSASYRDRSVTYRSVDEILVLMTALGGRDFARRAYLAHTSKGTSARRSHGSDSEGGQ